MNETVRSLADWRLWRGEERRATIRAADGRIVTLISRTVTIRWPRGGGIRQRPVAIEVHDGARTHRLPVRDMTRWINASVVLTGLMACAGVSAWVWRGCARERSATT